VVEAVALQPQEGVEALPQAALEEEVAEEEDRK
jgi:hypothetical protein